MSERTAATKLRKLGFTYKEIRGRLGPIPKTTLNYWFKNIQLTGKQIATIEKRVKNRMDLGRERAGKSNRNKRLRRIAEIKNEAIRDWVSFLQNKIFLAGFLLYLAEGNKKTERFEFMNSDPDLIMFMIKWLNDVIGIKKHELNFRLYAHQVYANEKPEEFWKERLQIQTNQFKKTVYKLTAHSTKKNLDYKGCLRLTVPGSELYWKILTWRDKLKDILRS